VMCASIRVRDAHPTTTQNVKQDTPLSLD
jgi:hypothetical protein